MFAAHPVPTTYRRPVLGPVDPRFRRALTIAGSLGLLFLVAVWIAPEPAPKTNEVEELPERLARLILEDPAPPAPPAPATKPKVAVETPEPIERPKKDTPAAKPKDEPSPAPERRVKREDAPRLAEDRGTAGREKARAEVQEKLAAATSGVDEALETLAAALPATESSTSSSSPARRRGGRVRGGRSAAATGAATTRSTSGAADLREGGVRSSTADLGALGAFDLAAVDGTDPAAGLSSAPAGDRSGDRSAADLMKVVARYAPGIRFCYDGALERDPGLRGKMAFRIVVAADGSVDAVEVVEDTLSDASTRSCALTQIRSWRFGAAASASTFDAPFVFRPTD